MTEQSRKDDEDPDDGADRRTDFDIEAIVEALRVLHDQAYHAYLPLVEDICSRDASEGEVDHLLDHMVVFAGEDRMLALFKRVCRRYLHRYPEAVVFYIHLWRDMYDEEYAEAQSSERQPESDGTLASPTAMRQNPRKD